MKFLKVLKKYWMWGVLIVLCLIPLIWFLGKANVLITGLDTNFPLDPLVWFKRRFFVWNGVNNTGVDFSSSAAGIFFHFIQVAPYLLGFSLKGVEIVSLIFWFSAVVVSSSILARVILPKNKIAQIIMVVLYSINIYMFNTWENIKVSNLALVASLPMFVAFVYLWVNRRVNNKRAVLYLCVASIIASGAGINPAYFSVIVLVLIIEILILLFTNRTKKQTSKILKIGAFSLLILVFVNMFWIIPLVNFLISTNIASPNDLGFTNWLISLSENTSILNIARLQGAWDWYALDKYGMPQYLPYTLNYLYKLPFILFSFVVPLLSIISLFFINKEKSFWYHLFGILVLLGLFMGVGAHAPTGDIFIFLVNHIPLLSFFRSPWYIFTPILTLSYAGLVGLLYFILSQRIKKKRITYVLNICAFIFLISYGLYNYPLITGKIFRPGRSDSFYVEFPDYVWQTKDWLNSQDNNQKGRIISYPDDQLEAFNWGYRGTESILSLFSDREIITPSFNVASKTFSEILSSFYSRIRRGEYKSAFSLMNILEADEIFYKKDVSTLFADIKSDIGNLVDTTTFGKWVFMKPKTQINKKIFVAQQIYQNLSNSEDYISVVPILSSKSVVVDAKDSEIAKIKINDKFPILLKAGVLDEDENEISNVKKYEFSVPKNGLFSFEIERNFVDSITIKLDSKVLDKSLVNYRESLIGVGPVDLNKGTHRLEIIYPQAQNLLTYDLSSYSIKSNLREDELPLNPQTTLLAFSDSKEPQEIKLTVDKFNPHLRYVVGFDYKYFYGKVPLVDMLQSAPTSPVKTYPIYPGSSFDWESRYDIFRPVETDSKLEVLIKLGPNDYGGRSKTYFENMFVKRIYDNNVFVVEYPNSLSEGYLSQPEINYKKISPVKYEIKIGSANESNKGVVIAFLESYSKDWVLKPISGNKTIEPSHFMIYGYANGWYVPTESSEGEYIIYYKPQKLYLIGAALSIISIVSLLAWQLLEKKNNA